MRRIIFFKIHLPIALTTIAVISLTFAGLIAYRSALAYGLMFGGRISVTKICILGTPAIAPVTCASSCPMCTGLWGTACASRNEVLYQPSGGVGTFACPLKAELWRGGGMFPRPGAFILSSGLYVGGPLTMPGLSR